MSEQPERMERWAIQYEDGEICTSSSFEEAKKWGGDEATLKFCRLVELRPGETIVGPLEMSVIEAAIALVDAKDADENYGGCADPDDEGAMLAHLAVEVDKAELELFVTVRALREARR